MESIEALLAAMNPQQQRAIETTEGPLLVMAGAGSGKTRVLTHRIAYLLATGKAYPWQILAITFTNKAAQEMKERVCRLIGQDGESMWLMTFHAMCVRILRRHAERIGFSTTFTIVDTGEQRTLMKRILKELNYDEKKYDSATILSKISDAKNNMLSPDEYEGRMNASNPWDGITLACYRQYQQELIKNNAMDFDDLLLHTVQLFQQHPDILAYYTERFQYLHVDEYQDTNHAQYQLAQLLASAHHNICVVGDSDQSIYGWRGADMSNILDFEQDYPSASVIFLEQNYRSTQTILDAANNVIQNNNNRKPKKLWTDKGAGEPITVYRAQNETDEARYVVEKIKSLQQAGRWQLQDIAVLYRVNAQSRALETALTQAQLQYQKFGGYRFHDQLEIKDVMAYLRLICNPADDLSFERVINVPKRGIGATTLLKLRLYAQQAQCSLLAAARQAMAAPVGKAAAKELVQFANMIDELCAVSDSLTVTELTQRILAASGYLAFWKEQDSLEAETRVQNIEEFLSGTQLFDKEEADQVKADDEETSRLVRYLTNLALITDADQVDDTAQRITLMTLHAAKGLEFPVVFLVGMEEGLFPTARTAPYPEEVEEERRLMYVGVTRAEQQLFLTHTFERLLYGKTQYNRPSRFLAEISDKYVRHDGYRAPQQDAVKVSGSFLAKTATMATRTLTTTQNALRDRNWTMGQLVQHNKWGIGRIVKIEGEALDQKVHVAFEGQGIKVLMAHIAPITAIEETKG